MKNLDCSCFGREDMNIENLILVNYCHPDCVPLKNIMRLPKEDAFVMAKKMAAAHPETTAFYRFADFENYYDLRLRQDEYLYSRFVELGGKPEENHPLSFVIEGSEYLQEWFGNGIQTKLFLRDVDARHVSFTLGDSGAMFEKKGVVDLLMLEDLKNRLVEFDGNFDDFLKAAGCHYIEVQLWSDKYCKYAD